MNKGNVNVPRAEKQFAGRCVRADAHGCGLDRNKQRYLIGEFDAIPYPTTNRLFGYWILHYLPSLWGRIDGGDRDFRGGQGVEQVGNRVPRARN
jgi:hypothetical protein